MVFPVNKLYNIVIQWLLTVDRTFGQWCFFSSSPFQNHFGCFVWRLSLVAVTTTRGHEDRAQIWTCRKSFPLGSREEGMVRALGNHPDIVENDFHSASCGGVFGILVPKSCGWYCQENYVPVGFNLLLYCCCSLWACLCLGMVQF